MMPESGVSEETPAGLGDRLWTHFSVELLRKPKVTTASITRSLCPMTRDSYGSLGDSDEGRMAGLAETMQTLFWTREEDVNV